MVTPPAPTLTFTESPTSIVAGQFMNFKWSATNATSCIAAGGWSGTKSASGAQSLLSAVSNTYYLTCSGAGGTVVKSVRVEVSAPTTVPVTPTTPPATTTVNVAPTLTLSATPATISTGNSSTLIWSSTNASSCVASGGWTGSMLPNGTRTITGMTTATYTLTCTGAGGSVVKSATVTVSTNDTPLRSPIVGANTGVTDAYGTTWHDLRIGAGGYISGIDIAPDGTKIIRTDTYGTYIWDGSKWKQMWSAASAPAGDQWTFNGGGVYELRYAPTNPNRFYMVFENRAYRSDNKGTTWTKLNFPTGIKARANDDYRTHGEKMAVDPANQDVVYAGTIDSGMFRTTDAGMTWTKIASVPAGASGGAGMTGITFDSSSGTINGRTKTIYVNSFGNGVYRSTDAGATWSHLSGGPTKVVHAQVAGGTYYATDSTDFWRYANGVWIKSAAGTSPKTLAIDPFNPNRIIAMQSSGSFEVSEDGGATWSKISQKHTLVATDIPWLADSGGWMSVGNIAFDPAVPGKLWVAAGVGVWTAQLSFPFDYSKNTTFVSQSYGIEQLVTNEIISPPGGKPIAASWDRAAFRVDDVDTYPSTYGPSLDTAIRHGWSVDWASSNPNFIVGIFNLGTGGDRSSYSTDGGKTWTKFETVPKGIGGAIAAASPTNIVIAPSNNGFPAYTKDGGKTWKLVNAPGASTSGESGYGWAYYFDRQIVAADRVNIGTFYLYNYKMGLYRTTDGGDTWSLIKAGTIGAWTTYHAKLRSVPGRAGNLFFTSSVQGAYDQNHPAKNLPLMRSTDGGVTWTAVPNTTEIIDVGFGAPKTPGGYPTIYIAGWVNNQYGIYASTDNAASWKQVGKFPKNSLDAVKDISGDMNKYGRVYVGLGGMGYLYGDFK